MNSRERRPWTAYEDEQLHLAVAKEDPNTSNPSKWHAIAKHVPERTNKDCRKRWFAKMACDVVKGGWAPDEDERLVQAIEQYGNRWSLVSTLVRTRNSDQCAKRWTDTLNPTIDRTGWTPEADAVLIQAVEEYGKVWTKIVRSYFPGRTGLAAKNRYNSITRFNNDIRGQKRYKTLLPLPSTMQRRSRTQSVSSSSSGSTSPSIIHTPDLTLGPFHSPIDHLTDALHSSAWGMLEDPGHARSFGFLPDPLHHKLLPTSNTPMTFHDDSPSFFPPLPQQTFDETQLSTPPFVHNSSYYASSPLSQQPQRVDLLVARTNVYPYVDSPSPHTMPSAPMHASPAHYGNFSHSTGWVTGPSDPAPQYAGRPPHLADSYYF